MDILYPVTESLSKFSLPTWGIFPHEIAGLIVECVIKGKDSKTYRILCRLSKSFHWLCRNKKPYAIESFCRQVTIECHFEGRLDSYISRFQILPNGKEHGPHVVNHKTAKGEKRKMYWEYKMGHPQYTLTINHYFPAGELRAIYEHDELSYYHIITNTHLPEVMVCNHARSFEVKNMFPFYMIGWVSKHYSLFDPHICKYCGQDQPGHIKDS
jgi:hypothetical protein